MKRIVVPTDSAAAWAPLLAKPAIQWKAGRSAMSLAACWEDAHPELPPEIRTALDGSGHPSLQDLSLVLALPEFTTPLPGGSTSSQTDVMVLARNQQGLIAIGVEGKVDEEFGPTMLKKRKEPSEGLSARLSFLHEHLGLLDPLPDNILYQLLHRTVAALLFAIEVHCSAAVMLVHSFSADASRLDDFVAFGQAVGIEVGLNQVQLVKTRTPIPVFIGWVSGNLKFTEVDIPPGPR